MIIKEDYSKTSDRISREKVERIVKGLLKDNRLMQACYIALSFNIGTRVSDTLDFTWDILLNSSGTFNRELYILEKKTEKVSSKRPRLISFSNSTLQLLKIYWDSLGNPTSGYLFVNRTGERLSERYVNIFLKDVNVTYLGKNRIKNFSSHSLRKGFAYDFYLKHNRTIYSLNILQKILNHSNVGITLTYLGISQREMGKAYTTDIDVF